VDDRNQFDLIRSLPGGLAGVRAMVEQFHSRGVKVFFPYFLWDSNTAGGTRNEGVADYKALIELVVTALNADGINGDTCDGINKTWFDESLIKGKAVVLEAQSMGGRRYGFAEGWENITTNVASWGESWPYTEAPLVSSYKTIEPRHMVQIVERFATNRTNGLQHAFFNGVGYESWENIWNMFNKISARDSEALRRIGSILREYHHVVMASDEWRPYSPGVIPHGVYGSRFTAGNTDVYLLVNRLLPDADGVILELPCPVNPGSSRYFDVYNGVEFATNQVVCNPNTGKVELPFHLEGLGFAAIVEVRDSSGGGGVPSAEFLRKMQAMTARELRTYSTAQEFLPMAMVKVLPTVPAPDGYADMMEVVPTELYRFTCKGNIQQGDLIPTIVDVQFPWEPSPRRNHEQLMQISPFWMDRLLVSNAQYAAYLTASGWEPTDKTNWLRHWTDGTVRVLNEICTR
jgi:hypothetical protein